MAVRISFFNCYCHWSLLVFWNGDGMESFLHSREGVMQGDPLSMVYSIDVLLLIKRLKAAYPEDTQPWYADNAGALGT